MRWTGVEVIHGHANHPVRSFVQRQVQARLAPGDMLAQGAGPGLEGGIIASHSSRGFASVGMKQKLTVVGYQANWID